MTRKHLKQASREIQVDSEKGPDVDAFGRDREERNAKALVILEGAFWLLAKHGWSPTWLAGDGNYFKRPAGTLSILEALSEQETNDRLFLLDVYNARRAIECFEWPVPKWERVPLRSATEVFELLRKAIRLVGGLPPSLPIPKRENKGRGGWAISSGPGAL